jgi:Rrf2 family protein
MSRTVRHAIRAAVEMARAEGAPVTVAAVARRHGIPDGALAKVLQRLVRAGIAVGSRGVGGGYRLAREASAVTVADVMAVFEPWPAGPGRPSPDPVERRLRALVEEVDQTVRSTFASVSLATLARRPAAEPAAAASRER